MSENHVARASVDIPAPADTVWDTLVDPEATWMMGARVSSTYVVGVPITFDGEWDGRPFQDHGEILEVDRPRRLRYTHYSPLSGQPDVPENYHHLTFTFDENHGSTSVTLEQDGNGSAEEASHATANWEQVLAALRDAVVADAERAGPS
ncbi:SRPBCC family protein [Cellulomonas sp.]|uniref:SRPBCC family protein n=1 Tax=Cellulomonas sp. TaxID=40001 RepID=UPI003BA842C2